MALLVEGLEGKYREAAESLLSKPWTTGGMSDEAAAAKLASAGLPVGASTIRRHRSGRCVCVRRASA